MAGVKEAFGTKQKETYMGSDGNLEYYPDTYQVTEDELEAADKFESFILTHQDEIESSFLKIGAALAQFDELKLYKAKGYPSFRAWVSAPEIHFSYEHANRLIRIVTELLPRVGEKKHKLPISVLKELLPMLADGVDDAVISHAYDAVEGMTVSDAKKTIRELRGMRVDEKQQTIFRAKVTTRGDFHYVEIVRTGGDDGDMYTCGTISVKKKDWKHWEARFGANFIEYIK